VCLAGYPWKKLGLMFAALLTFCAISGGGRTYGADEPHEKEHGTSHHNEHDLTHANAGPKLEDPSELRTDLAIYTFVVFILLLLILLKFAWGPIAEGLDKRESSIANNIAQAKQSAEKAQQTLVDYESKLAAAADETRDVLARAKRDAEATGERIVADAKAAAQKERDRAVEDIRLAKDAAVNELASKSVDTAVALAGRMIHKEVKSKDHADLIKEALEQFPSQN